jgi:hypothetical protein
VIVRKDSQYPGREVYWCCSMQTFQVAQGLCAIDTALCNAPLLLKNGYNTNEPLRNDWPPPLAQVARRIGRLAVTGVVIPTPTW